MKDKKPISATLIAFIFSISFLIGYISVAFLQQQENQKKDEIIKSEKDKYKNVKFQDLPQHKKDEILYEARKRNSNFGKKFQVEYFVETAKGGKFTIKRNYQCTVSRSGSTGSNSFSEVYPNQRIATIPLDDDDIALAVVPNKCLEHSHQTNYECRKKINAIEAYKKCRIPMKSNNAGGIFWADNDKFEKLYYYLNKDSYKASTAQIVSYTAKVSDYGNDIQYPGLHYNPETGENDKEIDFVKPNTDISPKDPNLWLEREVSDDLNTTNNMDGENYFTTYSFQDQKCSANPNLAITTYGVPLRTIKKDFCSIPYDGLELKPEFKNIFIFKKDGPFVDYIHKKKTRGTHLPTYKRENN